MVKSWHPALCQTWHRPGRGRLGIAEERGGAPGMGRNKDFSEEIMEISVGFDGKLRIELKNE